MKRYNHYAKYVKGETALHVNIVKYLNLKSSSLAFHHSPNEGRRTPYEQYLLKNMGVSSGFPDFQIFCLNNKDNKIIFVEIKYKDNVPTDKQENWLSKLYSMGYLTYVVWSLNSFINIFEEKETVWKLVTDKENKGCYFVDLADLLPKKIIKNINNG